MVQLIIGDKGKGKTKQLLAKANEAVKTLKGTMVYLDKSTKHMFELDKNIRLINVKDYPVSSPEAFLGFLCGILSQDHDLEKNFVDSFLTLTDMKSDADIEKAILAVERFGEKYGVDIVLSLSRNKEELSEALQEKVVLAL